jgi:hypothetical protein
MSNEVAKTGQMVNPYALQQGGKLPDSVNAGTVTIEVQRAIAEVQAKLMIAKAMPRDPVAAWEKVMKACALPGMAEAAFYSYKRGGQEVTGPSIRLAEALASAWGNIDYGMRELSNKDGVTELEAYAWDLETNTLTTQRFTVQHKRDTKGGGYALTDQRDIYELGANMGARRMRARILAVLPADIVKAAEEKCRQTLAGGGGVPIEERVKKMLTAFGTHGISQKHIEARLGKKLADVLPDDLVLLIGIHNSIKDGNVTASEAFEAKTEQPLVKDPTPEKPTTTTTSPAATGENTGGAIKDPAPARARQTRARPADKPADTTPLNVENANQDQLQDQGQLQNQDQSGAGDPPLENPAEDLGSLFGGDDSQSSDPDQDAENDDDSPF